eukprot:TRINITY_DN1875_c0_g1_i12.p1 TRINITY_DN1875_c0_g1~~TRINITY_DN1875_c0_g1_i12.p1  ORF type:complete len:548 (-),score=142.53 TRINITY_DN1875_c0_g1_i12:85-1728(-)
MDELLVGWDAGEGSMTDSGYPRQVRAWMRGTKLKDAPVVYDDAPKEDVAAGQYMYFDRGHWHEIRYRSKTFYTSEHWWRRPSPGVPATEQGGFTKIPIQDDADVSTFGNSAIITLRSDWTPTEGGKSYPTGALLSCPMEQLMASEFGNMVVLFEPEIGPGGYPRTSLEARCGTLNFLVLNELHNVNCTLRILEHTEDGGWRQAPVASEAVPVGCSVSLRAVDSDSSDSIWVTRDGYLEPDSLSLGSAADGLTELQRLKSKPAMFNSDGLTVEQNMAPSLDGTQVPYFVMRREDAELDGSHPTLLNGYGGFEISMTPYYSAAVGAAWLEEGGTYVIGNIRGGGEFGPAWHQAALREKRHKAYEDFEAIARDLVARKYTVPRHLACMGGSNGGLLVGNMLTREGAGLFGAIVCQVPLLDMKKYHKLLAGASWMAEYGDPDVPEDWAFLENHSPYQRLKNICLADQSTWSCPDILFTTSTKDDRVHPGHARKMARALLDVPDAAPRVMYWENIEGGHGAVSYTHLRAHETPEHLVCRLLLEKKKKKNKKM